MSEISRFDNELFRDLLIRNDESRSKCHKGKMVVINFMMVICVVGG